MAGEVGYFVFTVGRLSGIMGGHEKNVLALSGSLAQLLDYTASANAPISGSVLGNLAMV